MPPHRENLESEVNVVMFFPHRDEHEEYSARGEAKQACKKK
jgi:hypothetical protein